NEIAQRWPVFLPDEQHFLFISFHTGEQAGSGAGSFTGTGARITSSIELARLGSKERRKITDAEGAPVYAAGWLFFQRATTLYRQRFDEKKLVLLGEPVPVAGNVDVDTSSASPWYSASENLVAYRTGGGPSSYVVSWLDRSGHVVTGRDAPAGLSGAYDHVQLSPDRRSILVDETDRKSVTR